MLTEEFKSRYTEILWKDIKQMRNIVAHRYGTFDFDVLWEVVTEDIPELDRFCVSINQEDK